MFYDLVPLLVCSNKLLFIFHSTVDTCQLSLSAVRKNFYFFEFLLNYFLVISTIVCKFKTAGKTWINHSPISVCTFSFPKYHVNSKILELTDSTIKSATDSENGSGSDKSEPLEIISLGDESSSSIKSEDDFDNNLPETVTLLKHEQTGAKVYLVGTAHFSRESQEDVAMVRFLIDIEFC